MGRSYYCLISGLPELHPDQSKKVFSLSDFKTELENQLHPDDYARVSLLFLPNDNRNLLQLLQKKEFNPALVANYSQQELEEELSEPGGLKNYISSFLFQLSQDESLIEHPIKMEIALTQAYYEQVTQCKNPFLSQWFNFELTLGNILTALNCKKHAIDAGKQLIGSNELTHTLAKSASKDLGIGVEVPEVEKIVQIFESEGILQREKSYDLFRWNWLDQHTLFHYFSIEVIISYVIKLMMVERWMNLDRQTGTAMFERLMNDIETSYQFPKEYTINEGKR
ncbi:MAG: DUF2764 family protein [Bacteroidia bacterium]|nr:DUF2764 domain-containing protein [Bacteroidales bacterium]NCD40778.1 DUF2764 family protein [Bacteroidia bacterium]MDD2322527.1 DUF2764 family protein [Bacteroidales bacterium]MDD3010659.1 DUF2764 family protein [Bacteroidales bacterium]MDD3961538.1 DUF2764 family protein [Bacteroidales bacterium]